MPQIRTFFFVVFYVIVVILALPFILFCFLTGTREALVGFGKGAMRIAPRLLGLKIELEGFEKINRHKAYLFMSNHLSFLDGPLLFMLIPLPVRVILKKTIFRIPVIGQGMLHVGFVPVDRKNIRGGKKSIDRAAALMREKKYSFLIFPEGTRSRTGKLQDFRRGGFILALEAGTAIVPISLRGTYELMPKGQWFTRGGRIHVVFHEPVAVEGYTKETMRELMENVREKIASVSVSG